MPAKMFKEINNQLKNSMFEKYEKNQTIKLKEQKDIVKLLDLLQLNNIRV